LAIVLVIGIGTGVLLFLEINGEGKTMNSMEGKLQSLNDISTEKFNELSAKKIFFGHQSVGFNIIDGIKDIMSENTGLDLRIKKYSDLSDFDTFNLIHAQEGENTKPETKIDSFCTHLSEGIAGKADIVFLKFCYIDITKNTDIDKVFEYYKNSINDLKKQYPDTVFIHLTVPLESQNIDIIQSIKNIIKRIIGREVQETYQNNIKRSRFNEMLIKEYEGKEPVFDLAKMESMYPDGRRLSHELNGEIYYSMIPEYTYDGWHLNEKGRRHIAEQFIIFLTGLI
jgi:hypothetical protein